MTAKGIFDNQFNDFIYETAKVGITAATGYGSAPVLPAQTCRIDTVNNRGDGVKLPPSAAGLEMTIINNAALGITVYASGADTMNTVASTVGLYQPPNSVDTYWCAAPGQWHAEVGFGYANGLGTESAMDGIVAFAGGGQTNATPVTVQSARVATVATAGDSVKLPPAVPGLEMLILNHGGVPMQVYGTGADTIDDLAASAGVSQMQNSMVIYTCFSAGLWYTNGIGTGYSGSYPTVSSSNNLTATAGGTQGSSVVLSSVINRFTVIATAGDSARLPIASPGLQITVTNASAVNAMNVFPSVGDAINALAVNTSYSLPAGKTAALTAAGVLNWHAVLGA